MLNWGFVLIHADVAAGVEAMEIKRGDGIEKLFVHYIMQ